MRTRVGIDILATEDVRMSISEHERRYLDRVYTARELRDCSDGAGMNSERLAARFAAKEAVIKVLRPSGGIPWNSIGVRRSQSGAPEIELIGRAAEAASEVGVRELSLSIAHERGIAAAIVIADLADENV